MKITGGFVGGQGAGIQALVVCSAFRDLKTGDCRASKVYVQPHRQALCLNLRKADKSAASSVRATVFQAA